MVYEKSWRLVSLSRVSHTTSEDTIFDIFGDLLDVYYKQELDFWNYMLTRNDDSFFSFVDLVISDYGSRRGHSRFESKFDPQNICNLSIEPDKRIRFEDQISYPVILDAADSAQEYMDFRSNTFLQRDTFALSRSPFMLLNQILSFQKPKDQWKRDEIILVGYGKAGEELKDILEYPAHEVVATVKLINKEKIEVLLYLSHVDTESLLTLEGSFVPFKGD